MIWVLLPLALIGVLAWINYRQQQRLDALHLYAHQLENDLDDLSASVTLHFEERDRQISRLDERLAATRTVLASNLEIVNRAINDLDSRLTEKIADESARHARRINDVHDEFTVRTAQIAADLIDQQDRLTGTFSEQFAALNADQQNIRDEHDRLTRDLDALVQFFHDMPPLPPNAKETAGHYFRMELPDRFKLRLTKGLTL